MLENQQSSSAQSIHRLLSAVNTARVVADHESPMIRLTVGSVVGYLNDRCELIENDTRKKVQFVEVDSDHVEWHVIE
jgi:hypothetical protein